jgi:oligopeptidase B
MEIHADVRVDPYFWMKERKSPEVISYLKEENAYTESVLAPAKALRKKLFGELKGRIKQDESSYPFFLRGYYYYKRFEKNKEYPVYCRKKSPKAAEEILLNVNELAKGHDYTSVPFPEISPDSNKMLYVVDFEGRRFYDIYVKDLTTGKLIGAPIKKATGNAEWANDSKTFFYSKQHPETLRSQWVYRHELGRKKDELVYEEKDETFDLSLHKSRTEKFIFLSSISTLSTEWRLLDADNPKGEPEIFLPKEKDHEYALDDGEDGLYVVTNWKAKNFRLMKAPRRPAKKEEWQEVVPHRDDVLLEGASFFQSHYVLSEREQGLTQLAVTDRKTGETKRIAFPDPVYVAGESANPEYKTNFLRYSYESMNRPDGIYDYGFARAASVLRKQYEVPTYDASRYESERVWAKARDGTSVPISLVYKKGFVKNGKAPLFIYGYGSYGSSEDPSFKSDVVSLLDRGFVYAIAHIRGGSEMGRHWYEDGKLLKKMNTFTDFIDCTEHLLKEGYGDPKRVYAEGESAGGLLMGAVVNLRPDLYSAIHAGVPFVDVLTTMLDDSIPLTTGEYDEWGDPRRPEYYRYMAQYSPYDNVTRQGYPHLLVTTGLHDSQVQYWEPAKWTAKLRKFKTSDGFVLLHTEMDSGHGGASGRFKILEQTALEYAFFLMMDGQKE